MKIALVSILLMFALYSFGQETPAPSIDYAKSLGECTARSDAIARYAQDLRDQNAKLTAEVKKLKEGK